MTTEQYLGRSRLFRRLKSGPHGKLFDLYAARLELTAPSDSHLIRATAPLPPELTSVLEHLREVVR